MSRAQSTVGILVGCIVAVAAAVAGCNKDDGAKPEPSTNASAKPPTAAATAPGGKSAAPSAKPAAAPGVPAGGGW
jgi:hypothetical protein